MKINISKVFLDILTEKKKMLLSFKPYFEGELR
jgi:hypothetical protein